MSEAAPTTKPVVMFKKGPRSRPNQSRKRSATPPAAADGGDGVPTEEATAIVRPNKTSIANPLVQGSKRRRGDNDAVTATSTGGLEEFGYQADDSGLSRADEFATRSSNWDLSGDQQDKHNAESSASSKRYKLDDEGNIDDGMYHGQSGYLKTINTRSESSSKSKAGPIRATANIRTITLIDYQPDVCKPYKDTGFCGYGDSCKFMHDRGDYLAGWQLDNLDPNDDDVKEVVEEEEQLPFACLICRKEFTEPVVTKCGHYFCMKCAVDRFIKSPKCYACGAATNGIFNKAERLLAKLEAKRKRRMEEKGLVEVEDEDDGGIEIGGGGDEDEDEEGGGGGGEADAADDPQEGWQSA